MDAHDNIEQLFRSMVEAVGEDDFEAYVALFAREVRGQVAEVQFRMNAARAREFGLSFVLREIVQEGETANVVFEVVSAAAPDQADRAEAVVVKDDGRWAFFEA